MTNKTIKADPQQILQYSPVVLAYIGDAVYELMVRTRVVAGRMKKIRDLHRETVEVVRSESQARVLRDIYPELDEREQDIVRRGRNAKSAPGNRNNDLFDYKMSTGFEALLGFLYLNGEDERLETLVSRALEIVLEDEATGGGSYA